MGFSIYIKDENNEHVDKFSYLKICNLTYDFSRPELIKYWYGPNDMHNKTVEEVIKNLERAVSTMIADKIKIGDISSKQPGNINKFLAYLITQYQSFIKMPRNWTVELF